MGKVTGGRSLRAKNPGFDTSIRDNLELPALIDWLTSKKARDKGS